MSVYIPDDYNDDDEQDDGQNDIKGLRAAARKSKTLEKENADLKRRLAFVEAGIPTGDPKVAYFVKGYDGDLDPEAIRAAATEAGFIQAAPTQQPVPEETVAAEQRLVAAGAGAVPFDTSEQAAIQRLEDAFKTGGTEAMLAVAAQYGLQIGVPQ